MAFPYHVKTFWRKFAPLILVLVLLAGAGTWYRFWGPGEFNARSLKAYNSVLAALIELKRTPDNFEAMMQAGVGYYNLSQLAKAEKYYLKATETQPDMALPWNNLGNTYRELLRLEDAERAYQKAITLEPTNSTSYLNLANLYNRWPTDEKGDRHPKIIKILLQALKSTDRDLSILRALVDYYDASGDTKSADEYRQEIELHNAKSVNPPDRA